MDWLDNLGKTEDKKILPRKRGRVNNGKSSPDNIKRYKQDYYVKNIRKYNKRNLEASIERSIQLKEDKASEEELNQMIEKLSTDDIIYKMKYILDNSDNGVEAEQPKKVSVLKVEFF